ncbi:hypothetical protein PTKIN_Ptkin12aG0077500 [Pterospermum kingtungense]
MAHEVYSLDSGSIILHRSIRIHTIVQDDGSLKIASKHVFDELIPSYMSRLWMLHPVYFELRRSDESCSHSRNYHGFDSHFLHPDLNQSGGLASDHNLAIDAIRSSNEHSINQSGEEEIPINLGGLNHICSFCGAHMWFEERLIRPSTTQNLKFSQCCVERKVWLPPFRETSSPLNTLLDYNGGGSAKCFRENIRLYNSLFQFTSIGGKINDEINRRPGPYVFRLCGQNHHKIGSLLPIDGASPKFAQLYIYDTANELSNRMSMFASASRPKPQEDIVNQLIQMFNQTNVIVKAFRMAHDRFQESNFIHVRLRLVGDRSENQYSNVMANEVAGLIVGDFDDLASHRDIIVEDKCLGLQRISDLHPAFMAMQYPILFPYGEDGFHLDIKYRSVVGRRQTKRGSVTAREYYAFVIQQRLGQGATLIKGGLFDALARGDRDATSIGKRIILPATFTAGPRYLMQNYQDAMKLSELALDKPCGEIKVRILRKWFGMNFKKNRMMCFDFLMVDEQGTALQATMAKTKSDSFDSNIKEGSIYTVSNFRTAQPKHSFNAISSPLTIAVTRETKFTELHSADDQIPTHYFQFVEFENLRPRLRDNNILTGKTKIATSLASKLYLDLDIPIVADLKHSFGQENEPVNQLQMHEKTRLSPAEQEKLNRVNIQQLLSLDHQKTAGTIYTCVAHINDIDCTQGWYYVACKICLKRMLQVDRTYFCKDHGETKTRLCYKLLLNVMDDIDKANFIAFNDVAERMTGVTVARLNVAGHGDKYLLPEPIKKTLLKKKAIFSVTIITKALEAGHVSFRITASRFLDSPTTSTPLLCLPSTTDEPKASASPTEQSHAEKIPEDLFPEESPIKKIKLE